jgi:ATP-dependent helicase HrpA
VESTLRNLAGKPGAARAALDDARDQIAALLPKGLFLEVSLGRLAHLSRYLRGIQVRLERLPQDPRRDGDKAAQVVPLWQAFRDGREALIKRGVPEEELEAFRWLVEELRVALFAPELKTALPVSPQKVAERWKFLAG